MSHPPQVQVVYVVPLSELPGIVLDIGTVATPCRFRFIDCQSFINDKILRIVEISELRAVPYSVISYVWRGNPLPVGDKHEVDNGFFTVRGAEDGDPISIDVLRYACLASVLSDEFDEVDDLGWQLPPARFPNPRLRKAPYIWLDRTCIVQTSRDDKAWQIRQMFDVYQQCTQCLVLPGGIQRIVPLDEETAWVHRAWTLQEMLAPGATFVLFAWPWGTGEMASEIGEFAAKVHVIVSRECAAIKANILLNGCIGGMVQFSPGPRERHPPGKARAHISYLDKRGYKVPVAIFGAKTPNLRALLTALDSVDELRDRAIWQSALARTSSRPVDMVFSIMGLFGVSLDPKAFKADNRIGATVALAQAILRSGGSASWIGTSTCAVPCPQLSTFSEFPRTSVSGKAILFASATEPIEAGSLLDGDAPETATHDYDAIMGDMDDSGYLIFERKTCFLEVSTESDEHAPSSMDGRRWHFNDNVEFATQTYPRSAAVVLGVFSDTFTLLAEDDSDSDSEDEDEDEDEDGSSDSDADTFKMILIEEHAPGNFHISSYFALQDSDDKWTDRVKHWTTCPLRVGGPQPLEYEPPPQL